MGREEAVWKRRWELIRLPGRMWGNGGHPRLGLLSPNTSSLWVDNVSLPGIRGVVVLVPVYGDYGDVLGQGVSREAGMTEQQWGRCLILSPPLPPLLIPVTLSHDPGFHPNQGQTVRTGRSLSAEEWRFKWELWTLDVIRGQHNQSRCPPSFFSMVTSFLWYHFLW